MPGPWKEWKTKPRFPTLPTVPWKSRLHREIPTFPPPRLALRGKLENHKPVSHFPSPRQRRRLRSPSPHPKKKGSRPLRGLLALPTLRIILYWNQDLVSGSFLDWKMLRAVPDNTPFPERFSCSNRAPEPPSMITKAYIWPLDAPGAGARF